MANIQVMIKPDETRIDLRTQILANAADLFPGIVAVHRSCTDTGIVSAEKVFSIITLAHENPRSVDWNETTAPTYQAILMHGELHSRKAATRSAHFSKMIGALHNLLVVTASLMSEVEDVFIAPTPKTVEIQGGKVNANLLPQEVVASLDWRVMEDEKASA